MCAIIGSLGNNLPTQEQFKKARDAMTHRGPDDSGLYYNSDEGIALGFRRLSVIDWGKDCLKKLNGMFAFAIWERKEQKFFCARDRLGVKPFFYFLKEDTLYFSSEIKGLLALGVPRVHNENIIFDYLYCGMYDHTEETFFDGIKQLRAGHYGIFKEGDFKFTQYWTLKDVAPKSDHTRKEEVHESFKALMRDSIMLRFRSDVPAGILLSSGLDSNSLLYYSKSVLNRNIDTFSMCYESDEYNECGRIENHLASEQRKKWHTVTPKPSYAMEEAFLMNKTQDQPFGGMPTIA